MEKNMHLTKKGIASLALMGLTGLSAAPSPVLSGNQVYFGGQVKPFLKWEKQKHNGGDEVERNLYEIHAATLLKGSSSNGKAFAQVGTRFKYDAKQHLTVYQSALEKVGAVSIKVDDVIAGYRLVSDATYSLSLSAVRHNELSSMFSSLISNKKSTQGFLLDFAANTASMVDSVSGKVYVDYSNVNNKLQQTTWHAGLEVEGISGTPVVIGYQISDLTSAKSDANAAIEKEKFDFKTSQLYAKFSPMVSGMAVSVDAEYIINHEAEKGNDTTLAAGNPDNVAFQYIPLDEKYNDARAIGVTIGGIEEVGDFCFKFKGFQVGAHSIDPLSHQLEMASKGGAAATLNDTNKLSEFAKLSNYTGFSVTGDWAATDNFTLGGKIERANEYKEDLNVAYTYNDADSKVATVDNNKKNFSNIEIFSVYKF
jgi:hypothetical protein